MDDRRDLARGVAVAAAFCALWVAAAIVRADTTFHLAPPIVAACPSFIAVRHRLAAVAAGLAMAVGTGLGMAAAGLLGGPSLLPWGGGLMETLVGAAAGAGIALTAAVISRLPDLRGPRTPRSG
jgi:hypothetical protein